jgi:hypothetical protein
LPGISQLPLSAGAAERAELAIGWAEAGWPAAAAKQQSAARVWKLLPLTRRIAVPLGQSQEFER